MNRIFIVYNPRSSRFFDVKKGVLSRQKEFKGFCLGKYEVEPTDVDKNADKFAKVLKDGDFVIAAGGGNRCAADHYRQRGGCGA